MRTGNGFYLKVKCKKKQKKILKLSYAAFKKFYQILYTHDHKETLVLVGFIP